jgi:hypothetical protein
MVGLWSSVGSGVRFIVTASHCPAFLVKLARRHYHGGLPFD